MVSEQFPKKTFAQQMKEGRRRIEGSHTPAVGVRRRPNPQLKSVVKFKAGRRPISLGRALLKVLKGDRSIGILL
jgi:hypothetical protein